GNGRAQPGTSIARRNGPFGTFYGIREISGADTQHTWMGSFRRHTEMPERYVPSAACSTETFPPLRHFPMFRIFKGHSLKLLTERRASGYCCNRPAPVRGQPTVAGASDVEHRAESLCRVLLRFTNSATAGLTRSPAPPGLVAHHSSAAAIFSPPC